MLAFSQGHNNLHGFEIDRTVFTCVSESQTFKLAFFRGHVNDYEFKIDRTIKPFICKLSLNVKHWVNDVNIKQQMAFKFQLNVT